jgi:hypothetical protein
MHMKLALTKHDNYMTKLHMSKIDILFIMGA